MLLMSRARSAGRDKAMLAFENMLTVGTEGTTHAPSAATYHEDNLGNLGLAATGKESAAHAPPASDTVSLGGVFRQELYY